MRTIKPGLRLRSAVCSTQIMVIRSAGGEFQLCCGGVEMIPPGDTPPPETRLDPTQAQGSLIGKRYIDAAGRVELLCTQGGEGSLTLNGAPMGIKPAQPLPSSD